MRKKCSLNLIYEAERLVICRIGAELLACRRINHPERSKIMVNRMIMDQEWGLWGWKFIMGKKYEGSIVLDYRA